MSLDLPFDLLVDDWDMGLNVSGTIQEKDSRHGEPERLLSA